GMLEAIAPWSGRGSRGALFDILAKLKASELGPVAGTWRVRSLPEADALLKKLDGDPARARLVSVLFAYDLASDGNPDWRFLLPDAQPREVAYLLERYLEGDRYALGKLLNQKDGQGVVLAGEA